MIKQKLEQMSVDAVTYKFQRTLDQMKNDPTAKNIRFIAADIILALEEKDVMKAKQIASLARRSANGREAIKLEMFVEFLNEL